MKGWYGVYTAGVDELLRWAEGSGWVRFAIVDGPGTGGFWMAGGGTADLMRRVRAGLEKGGRSRAFDLFSPQGHVHWTGDLGLLSGVGTPLAEVRVAESELEVRETRYLLETDGKRHRALTIGPRGGFSRLQVRELWSAFSRSCPAVQYVALEKEGPP